MNLSLCKVKVIRHKIKTIKAKINNVPPSFCTSIPRIKICDNIAPEIIPSPKIDPIKENFLNNNNNETNNSKTPVPILP